MKKSIAFALAALLALALAACGGNTPGPDGTGTTTQIQTDPSVSGQPTEGEYVFESNGVTISMGADPAPILEALGEPLFQRDEENCAIGGRDFMYNYQGFVVNVTYPDAKANMAPFVAGLRLTDDTVTTPEGLYIGAEPAMIKETYGADCKEENNFFTYAKGKSTLEVSIAADKKTQEVSVNQILYAYVF